MKQVLYLCQLLPYPLDSGPKVRAYHVLRRLAEGHRVTLLAFTRHDDRPEAVEHLRSFCKAVHTVPMARSRWRDHRALAHSALTGHSFVIRRDYVPEMARKVDQLLAENPFDFVHADQLWMAQYALRIPDSGLRKARLVLDEHNACYLIFQRLARGERNPLKRMLLEREWRALARYEAWACGQFDHVVTVTDEDQRALKSRIHTSKSGFRNPHFTTIPICVDPAAAQPVEPLPKAQDILHLGTMFFLPNVEGVHWFARQVWPHVRAQVPEATFSIVGKNPPASIRRLSRQHSTSNVQRGNAIRVTGYVFDPQPYLKAAGVFIVPVRSGGGMRVKILDAWCWGLPVVSTSIGAEGINCRDGENILLTDDVASFAQAVIRVLQNQDLALRLRRNGRRWVEQHYDWRNTYQAWDDVYRNEGTY